MPGFFGFGTDDNSSDHYKWSLLKHRQQRDLEMQDMAMEPMRLAIAGTVIVAVCVGFVVTNCGGPDNSAGLVDLVTGSTNCRVVTTEEGDTVQSAAAKAIERMGVDPTKVTGLDERARQAEQFGGSARVGREVEACTGDDNTKVTQVNVR